MDEINIEDLFKSIPPIIFSSLFCEKMRERDDLQNSVSTRQALAIPKLLVATCFRKSTTNLTPEDYLRAAVITTAPEDQEIARSVVMDILFPKLSMKQIELDLSTKKDPSEKAMRKQPIIDQILEETQKNAYSGSISQELLDGVVDFLGEMGSSMSLLSDTEDPDGPKEKTELDFFFDATANWKSGTQPYKALVDYLVDPTEILIKKLQNLKELKDYVGQKLISSINNIPTSALSAIPYTNTADAILKDSKNQIEKTIAEHTLNQMKEFEKSIQQMMQTNPESVAIVSKALHDSGRLSWKKHTELIEQAAKNAKTSSEIYNLIKNANYLSKRIKEQLFDILSKDSTLTKPLEMILSLENQLGQSLSVDFIKQLLSSSDVKDKISYQALPAIPFYSKEIENTVVDSCNNQLAKLQEKSIPRKFEELFHDIADISSKVKNPYYASSLDKIRNAAANAWMTSIHSKQSFLNTGFSLVRQGVKLNEQMMMEYGQSIGCSVDELNEMLYTDFESFLKSIRNQSKDVFGYKNSLQGLNLTQNQVQMSNETALSHKNRPALGALASENLSLAIKTAQKMGAEDFLLSSLSAGFGEDILRQWFIFRDDIPSVMRDKLKKILRKIVISTAMDMARKKLGSAESGIMASSQTRPFKEGDELDLIDIEQTLENIISMGKNSEQIIPDDFIVHDQRKGRIALVILLDISGSMTGKERLAYCSFLITMLLSRLKEQEIGIALFESDTHVLLEVMDEKPEIDKVIDELLEIRARGGTVINRALTWAYDQFKKIDEEQLYFLVASDFEFFYNIRNHKDFKGLQKLSPKTYLIAPGVSINNWELKQWEKAFKANVVQIHNEKEIIDTVCKIISNR